MYLSLLEHWKYGLSYKRIKSTVAKVSPSLLENLRCHSTDEYPVISSDDETPIPPLACSFSKLRNSGHILALVDENGSLVLYNTNLTGDNAIITDWTAHNNAVFDVEWNWCDNKLLTASGDQTVCLWDVTAQTKLLTFKGHTSSVRSVRYRPRDGAVFASGSRDGHVRIWDSRCNIKDGKVSCVGLIKNAHSVGHQAAGKKKKARTGSTTSQDSQQSVTCVLFQNDDLLATSGAVDGCVKVWDIRKLRPDTNSAVYNFPYTGTSKRTHGYSSLVFDSYYSRLYASCTDDVIYTYDFITYNKQPVCTYRGHRNTSFYVKAVLSPDDQFLLSGSTDEHAYIWQVSKSNASPVILKGHRSEISDVAWCKTDLFRIVTTSDDNSMRVWRYDPTAEERKRIGRSDISCGITGAAERTHRDIGTSFDAPQTPKRSPCTLKRSATLPFGPVTDLTPKRARTCLVSTPSPSIKMWLKRSASEPSTSASEPNSSASEPKSGACEPSTSASEPKSSASEPNSGACEPTSAKESKASAVGTDNSTKSQEPFNEENSTMNMKDVPTEIPSVNYANSCAFNDSENFSRNHVGAGVHGYTSSPKRQKLEFKSLNETENKLTVNKSSSERKSCKRKLTAIDRENSPKKLKKQKNDFENADGTCLNENNLIPLCEDITQNTISPSQSPTKRDTVLKDLDSEINRSPEKLNIDGRLFASPARNTEGTLFASPARIPLKDWNTTMYQSPTANLPNIVIDGPLTNQMPGIVEECKKKTVDWLTQMRIQKMNKHSPQGKVVGEKVGSKSDELLDKSSVMTSSPRTKGAVKGTQSIRSFFTGQTTKS